jgi:hypothetical protein
MDSKDFVAVVIVLVAGTAAVWAFTGIRQDNIAAKACANACLPYVKMQQDGQCFCLTETGDYRRIVPAPEKTE